VSDVTLWLKFVGDAFDLLPGLYARWDTLTQDERDDQDLAWTQYIAQLEWLDQVARAGTMTTDQQVAYEALLAKIRQTLPLIDKMGLVPPTVSLDSVAWDRLPVTARQARAG
jgi:hypothetical protein